MAAGRNARRFLAAAVGLVFAWIGAGGSGGPGAAVGVGRVQAAQPVIVGYPAVLADAMERSVAPAFERATPYVFRGETWSAFASPQLPSEGLNRFDVWITADVQLARDLWAISSDAGSVPWVVHFLADRMVLAYGERGRFTSQLDAAAQGRLPWTEVVTLPGFRLGRPDPAGDPKGYRFLLLLQLASAAAGDPGLAGWVLANETDRLVVPAERLLDLAALGRLDAAVAYRSEAISIGLRFVPLPDEIDLGSAHFADWYRRASLVTPDGRVRRGEPITYALAIPRAPAHPEAAVALARFLLSSPGLFLSRGLRPIAPRLEGERSAVPEGLRSALPQ